MPARGRRSRRLARPARDGRAAPVARDATFGRLGPTRPGSVGRNAYAFNRIGMTDHPADDARTGLPVFTTWPAVYALVAALLVAYVVGLAALSAWSW